MREVVNSRRAPNYEDTMVAYMENLERHVFALVDPVLGNEQ